MGSEPLGSQYDSESEDDVERFGCMRDNVPQLLNNYMLFISVSDTEDEWSSDLYEHPQCNTSSEPVKVLNLDFGEFLRTMQTDTDGAKFATLKPKLVQSSTIGIRPKRSPGENRCLTAFIEIKNVKLENPVTLQLGTKGSRSCISYGCTSTYTIKSSKETASLKDYFDIANVDRYDTVVGTVFMQKHKISLDFGNDTVRMDGHLVPTLSGGEESAELAC
ncbi:hypothetical protein L218DRAFT_948678 [Marasmius fiardii PR-910]|nr:hypothetical protein L218DRAFT_948678 [Marasmius fiardii PR-910]